MATESARRASVAVTTRRAPNARLRRLLGRDWQAAYLFALPLALLLFGLIAYPIFYALRLSFYNVIGNRVTGFVGLANYQRLWDDLAFREAVLHTVQFAVISVFIKFWFGLSAALLLNKLKRFRAVLTALVLLPWIIPEVVAALIWRGLYNTTYGGLNQTAQALGILGPGQAIDWLGNYNLALPAMILVNVWKGIPFFTIILLAGLKSIDSTLYDAAAVDGANGWQRFVNITLPGLRYVTIVAALLSLIFTLNAFGLIYLITGGGPGGATRIFSILAYELAFSGVGRPGQGIAVTMALVPVLLVMILVLGRYMRGDTEKSTIGEDGPLARFARQLHLSTVWPFALAIVALFLYVFAQLHISLVIMLLAPVIILAVRYAIDALEGIFSAVGGALKQGITRGRVEREGRLLGVTKRVGGLGAFVALGALVIFELYPFYFMIITAFKQEEQVRTSRSIFWPDPFTWTHFNHMLNETLFVRWFLNSLQVAIVSCLLSVLIGALGAYALTRLKWRGAGFMSTMILFVYLMPSIMVVIPLYRILSSLGQTNSLTALMICYPSFGLPFACWLLMGYYRSIPEELEEAAMIDGANHFQAFFRIILPLTLPALMTVGLFAITGAFNEFVIANIMINSENLRTLPVGLSTIIVGDIFPFGQLSAAAIMTAIPVTLLYMFAQRFMVEGLTAGSVKG